MRDLSKMGKDELEGYANFLLWQYRLVDALWFLAVEDKFGLDAAVNLNEEIWGKIATMAARDIKKRFCIRGRGLSDIIEALSYFPWAIITGYKIVKKTENRAVLFVPSCPPQEARLRHGRAEFPCKKMHSAALANFAKVINEKVKLKCHFAPPDPHPEDIWCEWEFQL